MTNEGTLPTVGDIAIEDSPDNLSAVTLSGGAGWAACDTPITWSVDTSRLKPDEAAAVQKQLEGELQEWTDVSGLRSRG